DQEPLRERQRGRGRERERERPDLSIRGRRDRSQPPRRFGEGLSDMDNDQEQPPPSAEVTAIPPGVPSAEDEPLAGTPEPPSPDAGWPEVSEPDWDQQIGWGREPEFLPESEHHFERQPEIEAPEQTQARGPEFLEPFEPDLPPSRTQRSR